MCSVNVRWRLLGCALVALASACGQHYVARGADLYGDGQYIEAAEVFERTEGRLAQSSAGEQARFGLYRGATFLKLGDAAHAARWLGYARSVVNRNPDALGSSELELLESSLKRLAEIKAVPLDRKPAAALATAPADGRDAPGE
jgi:hypothetical protein